MQSFTALLSLLFLPLVTLPAVSAQGALICGTTGWDILGATPAFYALTNPAYSTAAACKKLCTSNKCGSFAVGNGTCLLYVGGVASTLNANTASLYAYYDAPCIV
ncbi:hypothetical protein BJ875DRAFT_481931 [Amylocarpus encephaloides]|uniref:Apple domain-containing protein n=1 Tax=Amylocarpus encephaloides TaxID=45428 RepID=A0A9P7YN25_9HELO|nr:hypothetical protein BJ875DRAFT_481931 [Amylocarpus encephaloides]